MKVKLALYLLVSPLCSLYRLENTYPFDNYSEFAFADYCCSSLTVKSLGKAGVTQGSFLGSYVYINTDSNGFQEFLGPQDVYLFHHETHMFWAVRYIIVMRQMRYFTTY